MITTKNEQVFSVLDYLRDLALRNNTNMIQLTIEDWKCLIDLVANSNLPYGTVEKGTSITGHPSIRWRGIEIMPDPQPHKLAEPIVSIIQALSGPSLEEEKMVEEAGCAQVSAPLTILK